MQEAPSLYKGHQGTTIWYSGREGYILQIKLENKPTILVRSICTFTPSMGMDRIDGEFAQDIEEYFLNKELGYESQRLNMFQGKEYC